jgi:hypothetical protein
MHDLEIKFDCEFDKCGALIENKVPISKKSENPYL